MTARSTGSPYGPMTSAVRAFLVRFAGLGREDRARITTDFERQSTARAWHDADRVLGETIEQSGRTDERDALAGPLLQLVIASEPPANADIDEESVLDPIAEPALAALMALLVRDLLAPHHFRTLYAPFADTIPAPDGGD